MTNPQKSTKDTGMHGERAACAYLLRHGFTILGRNLVKKTGEIDILARKEETVHFVEVKSLLCDTFPTHGAEYLPSDNLHQNKLRKVARTAEWIVMDLHWEGEWQIDAALVWIRRRDYVCRVRFLPQIL